MTQKEKLYNEWYAIREQIKEINGTDIPRTSPSSRSVAEWKSLIESTNKVLERAINTKKKEDFFATEEGKAYKQVRESEMEQLYNRLESEFAKAEGIVRDMVRQTIGRRFDVSFRSSMIEIGLVKEYEGGKPIFFFGHTWDIYYGSRILTKGFRFELNYGAMGSFELLEDTDRSEYLMGLGTFASDKNFLEKLKVELMHFHTEESAIRERIRTIDYELENPAI